MTLPLNDKILFAEGFYYKQRKKSNLRKNFTIIPSIEVFFCHLHDCKKKKKKKILFYISILYKYII